MPPNLYSDKTRSMSAFFSSFLSSYPMLFSIFVTFYLPLALIVPAVVGSGAVFFILSGKSGFRTLDPWGWRIRRFIRFSITLLYLLFGLTLLMGLGLRFSGELVVISKVLAENFAPLFLSLSHLSYFFIVLLQGVVLLTLTTFFYTPLEEVEQAVLGGPPRKDKNSKASSEAKTLSSKRSFVFRGERELFFLLGIGGLQFMLTLFFLTENIFVFFVTFEASVLPLFLLMGFFGKRSQKFRAQAYLLYFTLLSALPFLAVLLYLYSLTGSAFLPEVILRVEQAALSPTSQIIGFGALFLPFGVKFAFFPLHSWLPEAHVEASTEGSMLLSGIMLKLGFYGLLRYAFGIFGGGALFLAPLLLSCALVGALATTLSTYRALDVKKIIAYSSVVHMNLALFGYFSLSTTALGGALLLNFSHGLISAGLFAAVGLLQERIKTRNLLEIAGLERVMPRWSAAFGLLLLANAGVPSTVGFLAEATLLWGLFTTSPIEALLLLLPMGGMALRNFLLYAQMCWGVPHRYLSPLRFQRDQQETVGKGGKGGEGGRVGKGGKGGKGGVQNPVERVLFRNWDIVFRGEGAVLFLTGAGVFFFGLWPNFLLYFLEAPSLVAPHLYR